jgi:glycosyltransferase involved in cell wall biosynthesis
MARELHSRLGRQVTVLPHFAVPPRHIEKSPFSDFFLFSGRLDKRKGIMVLLDAFRKCSKSLHHRLFITGKGPLAGQISAFIKKHGLENRVLLLGYVSRDELWSLYRDATAVVVPSTWPENCPTVVMEAMTVGTPVIGSNCGALPEMISDINGNLLFNTGDSEDLAESLLRLGREAPRSDRITAVQRYSFINYLTRYLELVERSR